MGSGLQVLDPGFLKWNLDSGFQSFVGFQIPIISGIPDSNHYWDSGFCELDSWESLPLPRRQNGNWPTPPQRRNTNSCFQCLISGATVRDPVVSVDAVLIWGRRSSTFCLYCGWPRYVRKFMKCWLAHGRSAVRWVTLQPGTTHKQGQWKHYKRYGMWVLLGE